MPGDKLLEAYKKAQKYYTLPDFETFKRDMEDEDKRRRFHKSLERYYQVPDYNTFSYDLGFKKKNTQDSQVDGSKIISTPVSQKSQTPSQELESKSTIKTPPPENSGKLNKQEDAGLTSTELEAIFGKVGQYLSSDLPNIPQQNKSVSVKMLQAKDDFTNNELKRLEAAGDTKSDYYKTLQREKAYIKNQKKEMGVEIPKSTFYNLYESEKLVEFKSDIDEYILDLKYKHPKLYEKISMETKFGSMSPDDQLNLVVLPAINRKAAIFDRDQKVYNNRGWTDIFDNYRGMGLQILDKERELKELEEEYKKSGSPEAYSKYKNVFNEYSELYHKYNDYYNQNKDIIDAVVGHYQRMYDFQFKAQKTTDEYSKLIPNIKGGTLADYLEGAGKVLLQSSAETMRTLAWVFDPPAKWILSRLVGNDVWDMKGGLERIADYWEASSMSYRDMPNTLFGSALGGAVGVLPLIATLPLVPEITAGSLLSKYGIETIPKLATYEGIRGFAGSLEENEKIDNYLGKLYNTLYDTYGGITTGVLMHMMGGSGGIVGEKLAKSIPQSLAKYVVPMASATTTGVAFSTYDVLNMATEGLLKPIGGETKEEAEDRIKKQIAASFGAGFAFSPFHLLSTGAKDFISAFNRNTYVTEPKLLRKLSKVSPYTLSIEYQMVLDELGKEVNINKIEGLLLKKKVIERAIFTYLIDPESEINKINELISEIEKNEELSPEKLKTVQSLIVLKDVINELLQTNILISKSYTNAFKGLSEKYKITEEEARKKVIDLLLKTKFPIKNENIYAAIYLEDLEKELEERYTSSNDLKKLAILIPSLIDGYKKVSKNAEDVAFVSDFGEMLRKNLDDAYKLFEKHGEDLYKNRLKYEITGDIKGVALNVMEKTLKNEPVKKEEFESAIKQINNVIAEKRGIAKELKIAEMSDAQKLSEEVGKILNLREIREKLIRRYQHDFGITDKEVEKFLGDDIKEAKESAEKQKRAKKSRKREGTMAEAGEETTPPKEETKPIEQKTEAEEETGIETVGEATKENIAEGEGKLAEKEELPENRSIKDIEESIQKKGGVITDRYETTSGSVIEYEIKGSKWKKHITVFKDGTSAVGAFGERIEEKSKEKSPNKNLGTKIQKSESSEKGDIESLTKEVSEIREQVKREKGANIVIVKKGTDYYVTGEDAKKVGEQFGLSHDGDLLNVSNIFKDIIRKNEKVALIGEDTGRMTNVKREIKTEKTVKDETEQLSTIEKEKAKIKDDITFEEWEENAEPIRTLWVDRNLSRTFYMLPNNIQVIEDFFSPSNPLKESFTDQALDLTIEATEENKALVEKYNGELDEHRFYVVGGYGVPVFKSMRDAFRFAKEQGDKFNEGWMEEKETKEKEDIKNVKENEKRVSGSEPQREGTIETQSEQEGSIEKAEAGRDVQTHEKEVKKGRVVNEKVKRALSRVQKGEKFHDVVRDENLEQDEEIVLQKEFAESETMPKKGFNKFDKIGNAFNIDDNIDVRPVEKKVKKKEPLESLSNIVSKDEIRENVTSVFIDAENKVMVATDGSKMVAIPVKNAKESSRYFPKRKETIKGRGDYPKYEDVIKATNPIRRKIKISEWLPHLNGLAQTVKFWVNPISARIKFGDNKIYFDPEVLLDTLNVFAEQGIDEVEIQLSPNSGRYMLIKSKEGVSGVIMPLSRNWEDLGQGAKTIYETELTPKDKEDLVKHEISELEESISELKKKKEKYQNELKTADSQFSKDVLNDSIKKAEEDIKEKSKRLEELKAGEKKSDEKENLGTEMPKQKSSKVESEKPKTFLGKQREAETLPDYEAFKELEGKKGKEYILDKLSDRGKIIEKNWEKIKEVLQKAGKISVECP